ncbi:MAG: adenylosuccinate lyase [Mycoplasmataceae bacterium]|nr:adenylosuccinate lyase [Mycoplasmataceae bacterium]
MIERYTSKEMANVWSLQKKFQTYLDIEILACEAWSKLKVIPAKDVALIRKNAKFNVAAIAKLEETTHHDIVAFTRNVSTSLGEEKKWIHYGLTSTDIVDTANAVLIKNANNIIERDLIALLLTLKNNAMKYKNTYCMGRTHGIHADVTTFGLKWALWYDEMHRNLSRFIQARKDVEVGKLSGAVGNFANINPFIQKYVCDKLNINEAKIATQIVQRDNYANYFSTIALIGSSLEKIATEIRHLQRTEVSEVEESFGVGQKGSSAMPHKRNPIASENICGCARILRGYMLTAYENINLWHERDISHSSTERIMLPDATILLDYMLKRYKNILENLVVYPERMKQNIYITNGVIFAQRVMNLLINKKLVREKAYDLVQSLAMEAIAKHVDFKQLVLKSTFISSLCTNKEIENCFTLDYYLKNVNYIFSKVLK